VLSVECSDGADAPARSNLDRDLSRHPIIFEPEDTASLVLPPRVLKHHAIFEEIHRDDETGPWGFISVSGFTLR
jgi:hypothetical protein